MQHDKILLVKMLSNDDGLDYPKEDQVWHLVVHIGDAHRTFCGGEVYGFGESIAKYEEKTVKRGITCPLCRDFIDYIKKVPL